MNYLKRDDEENDSRYSNRLMEIIKNVNSNEEINTNTISNVNDINPKTGFSNRLTNILENTVGLDDYYKNQEKIIGVKNNIDNILKSKTNEQVDNKNVVDIEPIENKEQSQQEFETKKVSDVKSTQNISDKTKQEIDKEVKKATSQNIQLNTTQNNTNSITGNNVKIGLASQSDTQNAQELSMEDIQVAKEAKKKNENIKKGGLAKFEETLDTFFDNILGGVKQTISGLANIVTTGIGLGLKGLAGSSYILGLENTGKALDKAYNNTIEAGSNINEIANHERSVNSQVDDDFTRTVGDVTNVISNMMSSQVIGYAIPSNISGTAIQGLSVGGNSAQEVLDENKDNIKEATLTGIAKGYTSYLTEKMFDANILTKGTKKSSIQKSVDKLISDKVSSRFGKEISNVTVGIIGENIEELVEDNTDNLIDKLINNKDLPGFKEWWNNTTETVKITTLSTLIMNMIGLGGESFHDKEIDLESDYWLDQAQQIIEQEDLAIHFNPSEVKSLNDTKDFYITRFTPDNNIANVVATRGKSISNPNENLKIKPAIVKDNITNFYTIIDEDTGIVLDSTPYETTIEAESVFNEKINKLSDLQIRDINQKVDKANYTINNEFTKVISQAKNEISQMTPADYEINVNENLKQNQEKKRQNFENLYKTINQISDKSLYNKTDVNTLLNTVSNNIDNVEYVPEDNGGGILYSFDDDKNITTQQDIKGNIYTGKKIKNIVNTAIQNADITNLYQETDIGSTQTSSEQNASTFYSNETNYAVQDIKKVTEPFNKQSDYSKEEMADIWNDEISNNNYDAYYGQDGNIERYIAIEEDGDNIVVNQYDNNDNLVKSEVIASENGRYKASDIQDTIDRVASLYDENRPIKGQQDIEGNEVMSMKKKTNSTKNADIIKSIEKFSNAKKSISRQDIINVATSLNIYHRGTTFLDDNIYKKSGHTERSKIVKIDEYFTDYTNKEELRKQAYNYALQNYKNEVVTIKDSNLQIDISQSGIKKTFGKNQDNDKMQTAPKLVDIINESVYLNSSISTKNSSLKYHYFYAPVSINNSNKIALITIREDTTNMKENNKFYYHDIREYNNINNMKEGKAHAMPHKNVSNMLFEQFPPSIINNSISQNTNSVKNTAINNSMQKSKNNALEEQKAIQKELHNRIQNALLNKQSRKNTFLGKVSNKVVKKVKTLLDIDITGRNHIIPDYNIRHMIKQHGNQTIEKTKGQIAITTKDIEKIPDIIRNYDNIEKGSINTNSITSESAESIRYIKKYDNNISYVVEVVPKTGNTLEIKTMWKKPVTLTNSKITPSSTSKTRDNTVNSTLKQNPIGLSHGNNTLPYTSETKSKSDSKNNPVSVGHDNNIILPDTSKTKPNSDYSNNSIAQNKTNVKDDGVRAMKKSNSSNNQTNTENTTKANNSKNLIAQHNTSEEKLMEALDLGALPVPSIAITSVNTPIANYGNITLLFNKDTINPTDKRNVAYNSDIYSTRKPQTVNSLDKSKVKAFEKSMNDKGISYSYISQVEEYIQDNDFTRAKDIIRYELQRANPDITEQEIENSFTEAMETIKEKRILKEGIEPYTPSGNRKSIGQMSVPYTLDNIVRLMTKKSNKGSESNNFAGLPEIRANVSKKFKTIDEMHKQENNLVSTEEMAKVKEQLNNDFYNIIDEIEKYDKVERYFGSTDTIANALNETAKAKNISKEVLENELDFVSISDVPDKVLQKAVDFLDSLKNVPTEYFESKPQRAVSLSEIQTAIVPKNVSKELIGKLQKNNIPITYYNNGQERSKLIANESASKNIRFAKKTAKPENETIEPGKTNAQRDSSYIEQEIQKIEKTGQWDDTIPVTKMTDIRKTIEDYLGIGVQKGHFSQQAYAIYKGNRDVIRSKELKDMDSILHETGHALDIGKRINLNKETISNELLKAVNNYGGYEVETRQVQLEEGFAEVIREYSIVPEQARQDYPQTVSIIEGVRQTDKSFNDFITKVQQQTYNYIHQNPRNRGGLSNMSIGERTDQSKWTVAKIQQEVMRNIYDKDWSIKSAVNEMQKINGKSVKDLKASENAYYLTRLASGIGDKVTSMLAKGYIDENGNRLMPGLDRIGEILNNNPEKINDLRAYLVAQRDLEYKAKTLKTGIRTNDSKAIVEQFKNDTQIQEASKIVYDTLDGVMQYAVNNNLISKETANTLKESNAFYVPMQRVLEGNKNNVGRKGAVKEVIKQRTGSELDIKDILENVISNSSNIIQQVENNNILKAFYNQGEQAGMTGKIYDVIDTPMIKVGTAKLSTWENELKKQGVDITQIDFEKTIDLFAPNNKVDANNLITSFINDNGKRVYLQFNDEVLFNSLMNMDKKFMSTILNLNRKMNMPLRYGATMANIGFAIPNMISDTAQAAIFSEAGFIPVVDNLIGIMDVVSAQNKTARKFFNKIIPGYADRINTLYAIYEQTGATSSTRMSQYRETTQGLMKDVYGTKNSEVLGIEERYKPLKRLLDIMTYLPEISEQSTRFRVFEKNIEYYRRNGMSETDARIQAALQSRDATQDFGRTGNVTREINQLIPFSAARIGSAYTFAEKVKANPKRVVSRMAILMAISTVIKSIGYDDDEIEELNQKKKDDNFVLKIGDQIITIKKPQGILRSIVNLGEYVQDLFTGHIEEGKEGERLVELVQSAIMDNMPADSVTGLVPNMVVPVVENAINKDLYYNSDIVKSYDLELPDSEQYYDYNSQLAIWLGKIFNYSPAKIDNLISGYFAGLGTSITDIMDYALGKMGITSEQPEMGAEDNAVGKRFFVNVNSNSASVDEIYTLKTDLTKKKNGGTITQEEQEQLETITEAISNMSSLNKQIKEIKKDLTMSGKEKAEQIKELQQQKTDTARQALGKDLLYSENASKIESTKFYPSRDTLSQNKMTLTMNSEMKKEYEQLANEFYNKYAKQGIYSDEKLETIRSKAKDYAKKQMMKKYKDELVKSE